MDVEELAAKGFQSDQRGRIWSGPCALHNSGCQMSILVRNGQAVRFTCPQDAPSDQYAQALKVNSTGAENGAAGEPQTGGPSTLEQHSAPVVQPDPNPEQRWRLRVYECAHRLIEGDPATYQRDTPIENLQTGLVNELIQLRYLPNALPYPPSLSDADAEEYLMAIAHKALTETRNGNGNGIDPRELALFERNAVEAVTAWRAIEVEAREYSWAGLIRMGATAAISGLMGAGKTTLAQNVMRGWALGLPVLGRACIQARVLVVASPKEYENWLEAAAFFRLDRRVFVVESTKAHFGPNQHGQAARWFNWLMREHGCQCLILDTLFDFFGIPPSNAGDQNRIVMNEQAPLLQVVRENRYSGLGLGHQGKSEAKTIDPKDPEEAFAGHTGWMAQHRMRMSLRRKSQGFTSIITGRGGYGDEGILDEQLLAFDKQTRLVELGGDWRSHLGKAAMSDVIEVLRALGKPVPMSKLVTETGRTEKWVGPGLREARKQGLVEKRGKARNTKYVLTEWSGCIEGDGDLFHQND